MYDASLSRWMRAAGLALLTLATAACGGGDGGGGITAPAPGDPSAPSDPSGVPPQGPTPVGYAVYAVDLRNNLLLFGSESFSILSRKLPITGLPILKRIIGITFRPSDGKLYGVGNDSRVYTIDTLTAAATPVGSQPFSPTIASIFDVHFAMVLERNGSRVRLVAAESGGNWSISLDDGTATMGTKAHYAPGTQFEGQTPRLLGIVYASQSAATAVPAGMSLATASPSDSCEDLMYAIDADRAMALSICDPDTGEYSPTGELPDGDWIRCGELMPSPGGGGPGGPGGGSGGSGDGSGLSGPFNGNLMRVIFGTIHEVNSWGTVNPDGTVTRHGRVPAEHPIQTAAFAPGGPYGPTPSPLRIEASVLGDREPEASSPLPPPSDPRAQCPGA